MDEGLRTLDETIAATDPELRAWHSDFHRLRGELLIIQNPSDQAPAEACFQEALAVARHQGAVGWELRAAMSLARLLRRNTRRDEARQARSAVYGRYAEGLNLAILRDARSLLDELRVAAMGQGLEGCYPRDFGRPVRSCLASAPIP